MRKLWFVEDWRKKPWRVGDLGKVDAFMFRNI